MNWLRAAALFGLLAVACGAFGAHGLRSRLSEQLMAAWQTGVLYHLIHALALLALALYSRATGARVTIPCALMSLGIVLFSGSLYALALTGVTAFGIVTPFGGLAFLAGWAALFVTGKSPTPP